MCRRLSNRQSHHFRLRRFHDESRTTAEDSCDWWNPCIHRPDDRAGNFVDKLADTLAWRSILSIIDGSLKKPPLPSWFLWVGWGGVMLKYGPIISLQFSACTPSRISRSSSLPSHGDVGQVEKMTYHFSMQISLRQWHACSSCQPQPREFSYGQGCAYINHYLINGGNCSLICLSY